MAVHQSVFANVLIGLFSSLVDIYIQDRETFSSLVHQMLHYFVLLDTRAVLVEVQPDRSRSLGRPDQIQNLVVYFVKG